MNNDRRRVLRGGLAAGVLASTQACISPGQQKQDQLLRSSREFNNDIRWARYDTAAGYFEATEGLRFLKRADLVEDELVIADHEMTSIKFDQPPVKAKTVAHFEWYTKRDPVIRKTSVEQTWEIVGGDWRVTSQRRLRGDRFPLVPESAKSETADAGASQPVEPSQP
ncbi:MAG: hypothetical protein SF187_24520 [Deltaproteobacteria bacterium]|nr:hypothetical protein [Deltaproteobacteria bacterium]